MAQLRVFMPCCPWIPTLKVPTVPRCAHHQIPQLYLQSQHLIPRLKHLKEDCWGFSLSLELNSNSLPDLQTREPTLYICDVRWQRVYGWPCRETERKIVCVHEYLLNCCETVLYILRWQLTGRGTQSLTAIWRHCCIETAAEGTDALIPIENRRNYQQIMFYQVLPKVENTEHQRFGIPARYFVPFWIFNLVRWITTRAGCQEYMGSLINFD